MTKQYASTERVAKAFIGKVLAHDLFRFDARRPKDRYIRQCVEPTRLWSSIPVTAREVPANDA